LTLARDSIFVWDAASQSKKSLDMLKIWGNYGPLAPPMFMAVVIEKKQGKITEKIDEFTQCTIFSLLPVQKCSLVLIDHPLER